MYPIGYPRFHKYRASGSLKFFLEYSIKQKKSSIEGLSESTCYGSKYMYSCICSVSTVQHEKTHGLGKYLISNCSRSQPLNSDRLVIT